LALFEELHRDGCTIIVVTHAPDVAQRASRRIKLHDGRIVEDSSSPAPVLTAVSSGRGQ
jgi:putative ABC transport system ATP-binding protein